MSYEIIYDGADRDKWLAARMDGVGASESPAILGESPYASALSVYQDKIGMGDREELERMFWGLQLEPAILGGYTKRTGRPTHRAGQLLRSKKYPWMTCTLDGWVEREHGGPITPCEVKNVDRFVADAWEDGTPRHHYIQMQHQMVVTGEAVSTSIALIGGNTLAWEDVEADPVEQRRIIHATRIFWEQCVQARVEPKVDGSEASRKALSALHPAENGNAVHLAADYGQADAELEEIKARMRADEKRRKALENDIKQQIGDAEAAYLTDGTAYSWKAQRNAYGGTSRVLRRHQARD